MFLVEFYNTHVFDILFRILLFILGGIQFGISFNYTKNIKAKGTNNGFMLYAIYFGYLIGFALLIAALSG